jgi:polysaccharide pyruvyl transferase CsaB
MSNGVRRQLRVGVLGSYGGLNLGDEAILTCLLRCLREIRPGAEIVVFSRNPKHTQEHFGTAAVAWSGVGQEEVLEAEAGLDVLVLGSAGILHDGQASSFLRPVRMAHTLGIQTFGYAMGAGPLTETEDVRHVQEVVEDITDLTVRDHESKMVLERVGVTRHIPVTADPAVLLEPEEFSEDMLMREGIHTGGRLVGMSVREPGRAADNLDVDSYHGLLAEVADFITRRLEAEVVFVPMERKDISHAHAVLSAMSGPESGRVLNGKYTPGQIAGLMRHLDFAVGMRLHFVILAACAGVPVLPLPYAGKVFDFAQTVGAPALTGVARREAGPLLAELDRLWDERLENAHQLRERVRVLRLRALETCKRCRTLIEKIDEAVPSRLAHTPASHFSALPVPPGRAG